MSPVVQAGYGRIGQCMTNHTLYVLVKQGAWLTCALHQILYSKCTGGELNNQNIMLAVRRSFNFSTNCTPSARVSRSESRYLVGSQKHRRLPHHRQHIQNLMQRQRSRGRIASASNASQSTMSS